MKQNLDDFALGDLWKIRKNQVFDESTMTPSVILHNPKYAHNVGATVRAASCFGAKAVIFTGDRILHELRDKRKYKLPREERMKGYKDVKIYNDDDYPFNRFENVTPVAVEVRDNSEPLPVFVHPENALYLFGPEDGEIPQVMLQHCHRFIIIPSKHCLNLSAAVYLVLYDRLVKQGVILREDF